LSLWWGGSALKEKGAIARVARVPDTQHRSRTKTSFAAWSPVKRKGGTETCWARKSTEKKKICAGRVGRRAMSLETTAETITMNEKGRKILKDLGGAEGIRLRLKRSSDTAR